MGSCPQSPFYSEAKNKISSCPTQHNIRTVAAKLGTALCSHTMFAHECCTSLQMLGLVHGPLPSTIPHVDTATLAYPADAARAARRQRTPRYPLVQKRGIMLAHKHSPDGAAIPA